mmetsp:Transcript_24637/g.36734  ORF Transcript_24637/g.36734 Transcript_24637/m.36734 type:complete len:421 (-) Transcript_24637:152-1414(-)
MLFLPNFLPLVLIFNVPGVGCKLSTIPTTSSSFERHHYLRSQRLGVSGRDLHGVHAEESSDDDDDDDVGKIEKEMKGNDIVLIDESEVYDKDENDDDGGEKEGRGGENEEMEYSPPSLLPEYLNDHLGDLTSSFHQSVDVPLFLNIPKSGGTLMSAHYGRCLNLVESTSRGAQLSHEKALRIVTDPNTSIKYVNVDTTHLDGIEEASYLSVASSHLADVIFTSYLYESLTELFDILHPGRLFLLMRCPIEREVSLFYHRQKVMLEEEQKNKKKGTYQNITIEEYAEQGLGTSNLLVRMLTKPNSGQEEGGVTRDDLEIAKLMLQRKCLIGLTARMEESIIGFDRYFGWYDENALETNKCRKNLVEHGLSTHTHPRVSEGSDVWDLFHKKNELDMELYEFALDLYQEQREKIQMGNMNTAR